MVLFYNIGLKWTLNNSFSVQQRNKKNEKKCRPLDRCGVFFFFYAVVEHTKCMEFF